MKKIAVLILGSLLCASSALADEGDTCAKECAPGEVRASFLDGQQVNCACLPEGPGMVDTSSEVFGGEGTENTEGGAEGGGEG